MINARHPFLTLPFLTLSLRPSLSLTLCASLFLLCPLSSLAAQGDKELLETGRASKIETQAVVPSELKIVSYNIRWRCCEELRQLIELLRRDAEIGGAHIIGLQEVDRHKKRTHNANTAREMAEALGMYYAWAAPPNAPGAKEAEEETGVAILSPYPLKEVRRIVLPHPGPGGRLRVALCATVQIGPESVRVCSIHAETRISVDDKLDQFRAVLDDLAGRARTERAIVLGDFNTWQASAPDETTKLFTGAGLSTPFPKDEPTLAVKVLFLNFKLKLDWVWLRHLRAIRYGVNRQIQISDHWPLWVVVSLKDESKGSAQ